jgi:F-type H+-transporting ATPase subunit b
MDLRSFLTEPLFSEGPIHLVPWRVLYVVALVLVLKTVLNRVLFQPILAVLAERQRRLDDARKAQEAAVASLEAQSARWNERMGNARRDAHACIESARREAEAQGRTHIEETMHHAQGQVQIARDLVDRSGKKAEAELKTRSAEMAREIASKVLSREVA